MRWNGLALQTEFSETLGDTSTGFKARVLTWMNDIQDDIVSRHRWPFTQKTGKKNFSTTSEYNDLFITAPTAATVAISSGGSLTDAATYTVKVTYYQSTDGYETTLGSASSTVTASASNATVSITAIPVSSEPLVTSRRVYVSKNSGTYYYDQEIADNTTTTATISTNTTSTVEAPEYVGIKGLIGNIWIESVGRYIEYRDENDLRMNYPNALAAGTPQWFSMAGQTRVVLDQVPSSTLVGRFLYEQIPPRIVAEATSQPTLPIWLKNVLEPGVLWKGYQYRERELASTYMQMYEARLQEAISNTGHSRHGSFRVRDVTGDSSGRVY